MTATSRKCQKIQPNHISQASLKSPTGLESLTSPERVQSLTSQANPARLPSLISLAGQTGPTSSISPTNQSDTVKSNQSNRSQETGIQVSSPLKEPYRAESHDPLLVSTNKMSKQGQKSSKSDMNTKLESRTRKKIGLDHILVVCEKANIELKEELLVYQKWAHELDKGKISIGLHKLLREWI